MSKTNKIKSNQLTPDVLKGLQLSIRRIINRNDQLFQFDIDQILSGYTKKAKKKIRASLLQ